MARLYADENFPFLVVEELRRYGHDVLTVQEAGKANRSTPDSEVLVFASSQQRTILTLNWKDFIRLHSQKPDHAGIVVCSVDADFLGQAQRIHEALTALGDPAGRLVRVNRPSH